MESQQKKRSSLANPVVIGCTALLLVACVVGTLILGAIIWLFSLPEGGVRLANEMDQYALDYLEANNILEPNEELIAYYDATMSMDGTEAAILTTERVVYYKEGRSTAIRLDEIEDIQHRYESLTGDVIEVTSSSGVIIKIEIAPLNQGETFNNALMNAWGRMQE